MKKARTVLLLLLALSIGITIGGYLFSDTQPRSFLAVNKCEGTCYQPNELLGLLTSVGIQRFPTLFPSVVKETDKTIVIEHPAPEARIHYLVFPKKDIKNIGELSDADRESLIDSFRVVGELIKENNLVNYRVTTNGPGYQAVTYFHFHLTAR
jgi:histidine triad (HIT) family protein